MGVAVRPRSRASGKASNRVCTPLAPFLRATAVELIQNDDLWVQRSALYSREQHELGIGQKRDVLRSDIPGRPQVFELRMPDIFARRQPDNPCIGPLLAQPESNKRLSCAGGVNYRCFACTGKHVDCCLICNFVVRVKLKQVTVCTSLCRTKKEKASPSVVLEPRRLAIM